MMPILSIVVIYILAAIVPAIFLMRYVYRKDTVEKEPRGLLGALVLCGVGAALVSIVLESIGTGILDRFLDEGSPVYSIVLAFLVVAVVEEGAKYVFLRFATWKNPNFNYRFDAVVYAVFVSLGFAAFENIGYVFGYGLSVSIPRAVLAIPAHMGFAVFMGIFYGRAKLCSRQGRKAACTANLIVGYIIAVFLHGFYDACAMVGTGLAITLFVVFVVIMYIVTIRVLKKQSASDHPIY